MSVDPQFQMFAEMIWQEDYPVIQEMMDDTVELDFELFSEKLRRNCPASASPSIGTSDYTIT